MDQDEIIRLIIAMWRLVHGPFGRKLSESRIYLAKIAMNQDGTGRVLFGVTASGHAAEGFVARTAVDFLANAATSVVGPTGDFAAGIGAAGTAGGLAQGIGRERRQALGVAGRMAESYRGKMDAWKAGGLMPPARDGMPDQLQQNCAQLELHLGAGNISRFGLIAFEPHGIDLRFLDRPEYMGCLGEDNTFRRPNILQPPTPHGSYRFARARVGDSDAISYGGKTRTY